MISVSIFDSIDTRHQTPFSVEHTVGNSAVDYYLRFDGVVVYLTRARLAELCAVGQAALAAPPEAPATQVPATEQVYEEMA